MSKNNSAVSAPGAQPRRSAFAVWVEAMRLRTLPVSLAGVVIGAALGVHLGGNEWPLGLLCLLFALLAQIASNFGNEYFDFRAGLDKKGREGFRRGVTEGDISPRAMLLATLGTLGLACLCGLIMLLITRQWWLLPTGIVIAIFALAYSAGPWPLSHHGLGDMAVIIFFGIVPVMLTAYLYTGCSWQGWQLTLPASAAIGLMASNVLIVNNYRDADDDRQVGKHTTVVLLGRPAMRAVYLLSGLLSMGLMWPVWASTLSLWSPVVPVLYLSIHLFLWHQLGARRGAALNPLLGLTALNLLLCSLLTSLLLLA